MPSSACDWSSDVCSSDRSEEHTSELQSRSDIVCRLLLEKKKATHPASGPCATAATQRNPPPDFTSVSLGTTVEAVSASHHPPPARDTAPRRKPLSAASNP